MQMHDPLVLSDEVCLISKLTCCIPCHNAAVVNVRIVSVSGVLEAINKAMYFGAQRRTSSVGSTGVFESCRELSRIHFGVVGVLNFAH